MWDGGGGHWLVWMEWRPAGWSMCLPLSIFPCTLKSRSSLLAPPYPGGPGKRAVQWLWWYGGYIGLFLCSGGCLEMLGEFVLRGNGRLVEEGVIWSAGVCSQCSAVM